MKIFARIKATVPLSIFDEPVLQKQITELFNGLEEKFKARFNEIITFLEANSSDELSYENIMFLFKGYFYKWILNETIEMTFTESGKYDVLSNILSLLTEDNLETAIMGKPMIDAFVLANRNRLTALGLPEEINGGQRILLERKFL